MIITNAQASYTGNNNTTVTNSLLPLLFVLVVLVVEVLSKYPKNYHLYSKGSYQGEKFTFDRSIPNLKNMF